MGEVDTLVKSRNRRASPFGLVEEKKKCRLFTDSGRLFVPRGRLVIESDESKDYNEAILLGDSLRARLKTSNLFFLYLVTLIVYGTNDDK